VTCSTAAPTKAAPMVRDLRARKVTGPAYRSLARASGLAGALVVGALVATACSSAAKAPPVPAAAAAPTGSSAGTGSASSGCVGASASGASGSGDVVVPGDIPDNQAYVVYHSAAGGYRLSVPEGWARSESSTTATFSDKFSRISVQIASAPVAPSVASAQASDVTALAASVPCFQAGKVSQVARNSGPAVLITYRADSPADPVTGKVVLQDVERYEFWQSGKQATVTLSSPKGSDNVDPWRKVTDSFGWGA
jgi:hypothetical protein